MDESRKAFEQWFPEMVEGMPPGMVEVFDKMLFMAWEASRAAIEIELPDPNDDNILSTWQYRDATHNVLDGAGIKVKE